MSLTNEFININKEYDNKLYDTFKKVIDEALTESKNNNMNPIEIYIYVNEKLESAYVELALAMGLITKNEIYMPPYDVQSRVKPPISDNLFDRISAYMEPFIEEARKAIKLQAEEILQSKNLEELQEKYHKLEKILSIQSISEAPYLYENLYFTNKNIR